MQEDLRLAFQCMFGIEKAHDFQIEVADLLLNQRRSVILQAPTGSGKTWTALFPLLHAWQTGLTFPRKCLYAVPLRVLATQFKETAEQVRWPNTLSIQLQTGEQQDDPTLEGDLIFTTIDQVLSSALSVPYAVGNRRANINAGAIFSSFLVCDELHLFPVNEGKARGALPTLLELLRTIGDAIPFLLMTATLSEHMLETLADQLQAQSVRVKEKDLPKIGSQQKVRRYHIVDMPLLDSVQAILEQHRTRSIVICNQVERAIEVFDQLCDAVDRDTKHTGKTEINLLHSRFVRDHRRDTEASLRQRFTKPEKDKQRADSQIIVATQAIEVGLDITCERLHTELAPANAIIQRAGRCGRYQGEEGDVLIYRWRDDIQQPHLPYDAARCAATWEVFGEPQFDGQPLSFADEQRIVTRVHNPADMWLLNRIEQESHTRRKDMTAAMFEGIKAVRARLIREVDSRTLLVHNKPDEIRNPYAWRGFSLFHGTLRGWFSRLQQLGGDLPDWFLRYPVELPDPSQESRKRPTYEWKTIHNEGLIDASTVFVVHPDLVSYSRRRGFRLMPAETAIDLNELCQQPTHDERTAPFQTRYNLESYAEHIQNMWAYYRASGLERQIELAGERLERLTDYHCSAEQLVRAVRLAIALHDVGKLRVEWQQWSHTYQHAIGDPPKERNMMIVHTNYKPHDPTFGPFHLEAEKDASKKVKRPHHAGEGACASWAIIMRALDSDVRLSRAVFTAITRHHAPFASGAEAFELHDQCQGAIAAALEVVGMPGNLAEHTRMVNKRAQNDADLEGYVIASGDPAQWLIYTLIVRALRLCDGHALEGGE